MAALRVRCSTCWMPSAGRSPLSRGCKELLLAPAASWEWATASIAFAILAPRFWSAPSSGWSPPATTPRLLLARAVEHAAQDVLRRRYPDRPLHANVEFYTAVLLDAVGLERTLFTPTFAVGRVAGWCAHVAEQRQTGRLIRPESRYIGPRPSRSKGLSRRAGVRLQCRRYGEIRSPDQRAAAASYGQPPGWALLCCADGAWLLWPAYVREPRVLVAAISKDAALTEPLLRRGFQFQRRGSRKLAGSPSPSAICGPQNDPDVLEPTQAAARLFRGLPAPTHQWLASRPAHRGASPPP